MSTPPPYTLCRTSRLRSDEILKGPGSQPRFYLHSKSWTTGPTHTLLDGPTESAPRIAAYKPHTIGNDEICFGDPESNNVAWVSLDTGSVFSQSRYTFRAPDTGRTFSLEKSHDKQFGLSRFMNRGYLLKDVQTGNVVAVMKLLSFSSEERCGFEWLGALSWSEHILCLMAMISVFEKLKSQNSSSIANNAAAASVVSS